jgi:hypothetical protein
MAKKNDDSARVIIKGFFMDKVVGVSSVNLGAEIITDDNTKVVDVFEANFLSCPVCKSSSVEFDFKDIEPESVFVYRTHRCSECNTKWEERYDLTQVRIGGMEC